jgi:hypothetical protein
MDGGMTEVGLQGLQRGQEREGWTDMGSHVADLEAKINELGMGLRGVGDVSLSEELSTIIHRPGWTTVAEAQLVKAIVEALHVQVGMVKASGQALLQAARQVGVDGKAEAAPDMHQNLEARINELGDASLSEELLTIIHRPGWTTVAEAQLVKAMVDTVQAHTRGAQTMRQALLSGARQVGTPEKATVL